MRPTSRTQPYRSGAPRMPGMALDAMLAGRRPGQLNPADFNRMRQRRANLGQQQATLQQLAEQRLRQMAGNPQATADVRGQFSGGGFGDPHVQQLIAQLISADTPAIAAMTGDPRTRRPYISPEVAFETTGPRRLHYHHGRRPTYEGDFLGRA